MAMSAAAVAPAGADCGIMWDLQQAAVRSWPLPQLLTSVHSCKKLLDSHCVHTPLMLMYWYHSSREFMHACHSAMYPRHRYPLTVIQSNMEIQLLHLPVASGHVRVSAASPLIPLQGIRFSAYEKQIFHYCTISALTRVCKLASCCMASDKDRSGFGRIFQDHTGR